jgi:regulation of enolase protein 1 (concanavalin A-like superfamily)
MDYEAVNRGYPNLHKKDVNPTERKYFNNGLVVDINANDYAQGKALLTKTVKNRAGGEFTTEDDILVEIIQSKYAFFFDGKQHLTSSFDCPKNFTYNAAYTISAWIFNPSVGPNECIASITPSTGDLTAFQFNNSTNRETGIVDHAGSFESAGFPNEVREGEGKWQYWTVTFDGWFQRFYLNGKLIREKNNFIMLRPNGPITIGADAGGGEAFSGYIHSLRLYDRSLSAEEVNADYQYKSDTQDKIEIDIQNVAIHTEVITPNLIKVTVTDKAGKPLHSGQLSFAYYASSDPKDLENNLSKPSHSSSTMLAVDGKKEQHIVVFIFDGDTGQKHFATATIDSKAFNIFTDDFKTFHEWDGKYVTNDKVKYEASDGILKLTSADTDFSASGNPKVNGPMIYKEVKGDFIVQVKVADLMGSERRNTPAYNEGGLMVIYPQSETRQQVVQLGVFPAYNCGNMLTTIFRGRPQYNNQQGWNYDPYMQLQREGNLIYARTSRDGKTWTDMPNSPVRVPQFEGQTLRVGIFQTTYSNNPAWVSFSDFKLWEKR